MLENRGENHKPESNTEMKSLVTASVQTRKGRKWPLCAESSLSAVVVLHGQPLQTLRQQCRKMKQLSCQYSLLKYGEEVRHGHLYFLYRCYFLKCQPELLACVYPLSVFTRTIRRCSVIIVANVHSFLVISIT